MDQISLLLHPMSDKRSMKCYQRHRDLGKGDRKSSELKMTEKRVQPGEENGHRDTGDLNTGGMRSSQDEESQTGSFS